MINKTIQAMATFAARNPVTGERGRGSIKDRSPTITAMRIRFAVLFGVVDIWFPFQVYLHAFLVLYFEGQLKVDLWDLLADRRRWFQCPIRIFGKIGGVDLVGDRIPVLFDINQHIGFDGDNCWWSHLIAPVDYLIPISSVTI